MAGVTVAFNVFVPFGASVIVSGETVTPVHKIITVIDEVAVLLDPSVVFTVIVALPAFIPFTKPVALTVATVGALEV